MKTLPEFMIKYFTLAVTCILTFPTSACEDKNGDGKIDFPCFFDCGGGFGGGGGGTPVDSSDVTFAKIDLSGNTIISKIFDLSVEEHGITAISCEDGGYLLCATRNLFGYNLIRTNNAGDLLWSSLLEYSHYSRRWLTEAPDGSFFIGEFDGTATVMKISASGSLMYRTSYFSSVSANAEFYLNASGQIVIFAYEYAGTCRMITISSDGAVVSQQSYQNPVPENMNTVIMQENGFFALGTRYEKDSSDQLTALFIIASRVSASGQLLWRKEWQTASPTYYDFYRGAATSSGYVIAGTQERSIHPSDPWTDFLLVLDENGNVVLSDSSRSRARIQNVFRTGDDGYLLVKRPGYDEANYQGVLEKINSNGLIEWTQSYTHNSVRAVSDGFLLVR